MVSLTLSLVLTQAAGLKSQADRALARSRFQEASDLYARASAAYRRQGDPNAAQILLERSRRYGTQVRFFVRRPPKAGELAKHEPRAGHYLGVNVEREDRVAGPEEFVRRVRPHAVFFRYRSYGQPFPLAEARRYARLGAGVQIAFEPRSLAQVRDDEYLRRFAQDAARLNAPILLRFASEMNGNWVSYTGDPAGYRRAFRTVAQVMRREAPNVAMVWCPAEIPQEPIASYYPGPEWVDWVGVNFYSVAYNDADRSRDATFRWPTDQVDYAYRLYASRHPILVGEWAATTRSSVDGVGRASFAIRKIRQFYRSVPLLYPRLKAVHWLSLDTLRYAKPGRRLNDFSLLSAPEVTDVYRRETHGSDYLGQIGSEADGAWREVRREADVRPGETVAVWFRSYDPAVRATVRSGSRTVRDDGGVRVNVPFARPFSVTLADAAGRTVVRKGLSP